MLENEPAGHSVHVAEPLFELYDPILQGVQEEEFEGANVPAWHT